MPFLTHNGKNILFVHIPKTGGGSISQWLATQGTLNFNATMHPLMLKITPQHFTHSDMRNLFHTGFFDYAFTIVRNPYDRVESEYGYRKKQNASRKMQDLPPFSLWVERQFAATDKNATHLDNHFRPQSEFLGGGVKIFRFEDGLDKIIAEVAADTGLEAVRPAPHQKKTGSEPLEWDLQDRLRVQRRYREDFEVLGYEKDVGAVKIT